MKKTTKTALTAAIFAAALGVSAGGSIAAEAETQSYLAATDQRTMQILYGPGPNYNPNKTGDINGDERLDARDLTLMKRALLSRQPPELSGPTRHYNFRNDFQIDRTDARALMQHLTGAEADSMYPVEFTVYFKAVPYLSDSIPDSEAERNALEEAAKKKLLRLQSRMFHVRGSDRQLPVILRLQPDLENGLNDTEFTIFLNSTYLLRLSDGFAPNNADQAEPDGPPSHVSMLTGEVSYLEAVEVPSSSSAETEPFITYNRSDEQFSFPVLTFVSDPEKGDIYYDKCLVEWDVNTGKTLAHDSLTPDQQIPEA